MALETISFISDFVVGNPTGTDNKSEGDNHIRGVKTGVIGCFPGFAGRFRRVQTKSSAYTAVLNDNSSILRVSSTWTLILTAAATLGNGWETIVYNDGAGTITVDPNATETINGAATLALPAGTASHIWCDGTNFQASVQFINAPSGNNTYTGGNTFKATSGATTIGLDAVAGQDVNVDWRAAGVNKWSWYLIDVNKNIVLFDFSTSTNRLVFAPGGGMQIGAPTGGDKGLNTVNTAGALYENNNRVYSSAAGSMSEVVAASAFSFNSSTELLHSLGSAPKVFFMYLRCVTADAGYATNDEIQLANDDSPGFSSLTISATASSVFCSNNGTIRVAHKTTTTTTTLTAANWKLVARSWK